MKELFSLEGKAALVTGAARGIGAAIAAALAEQGADVAIAGRSVASLDETRTRLESFGKQVLPISMNMENLVEIRSGVHEVCSKLGRLDILVNNAGINRPAPPLEVTPENWDDIFSVNIRGGFFAAQAAAESMIEQNYGRIIFIASQAGISAIKGQAVYCASKAAVHHLARCLGIEWARFGITVNAVAPTFVETDLTRKRLNDPDYARFVRDKIPSGKLATTADVAAAVIYLASAEAGMVNSSVLTVDGGWTAW